MDFDPRDYDSRYDERFGSGRDRGGRCDSDYHDRNDDDLNITDGKLRRSMTGVWERRRQLRAVGRSSG